MKLSQALLPGLFAGMTGSTYRSLELTKDGVDISGREDGTLSFSALSDSPTLKTGLLSSTVTLPRDQDDPVILRGAPKAEAHAFRDAVETAWRAFNLAELDRETARVNALLSRLVELSRPSAYPSACRIEPIFRESWELWIGLVRKLQPAAIGPEQVTRLAPIEAFAESPSKSRAIAVDRFVEAELSRWKDFFDTVESKPLTPEQRLSIVVDEDATLVLAGAGSGKTSVITAKAAYLLKAGIRPAEQILLLAFAKDAATEMSERIEARCGMPINARTFHALAYDIIGKVEGTKPALAPHATDDTAFLALIRDILKDLVSTVRDVARAIVAWFAHFLVPAPEEQDFETKHEWYSAVEKLDLRTLQGEQVKSFEELEIANWLYESGVEYEYEPNYEHPVSTEGRRDYTPDFRLKESGIYIEHFGVRRKRGPDGKDVLTTAPYVDREAYLAGMDWKRHVHAQHGTVLIETFSYERSEGRLLKALEEKLVPYVTLNPRPLSTIFDRVVEMGQVDAFSRMLGTFLRQFKSGGYDIGACTDKAERLKMGRRGRAFLTIFEPVYTEYKKRLGDRIDFEDMILRAATYVEERRFESSFRHILVDEFQDISQGRARLIRALKAQHADARIFAVGDDWQSIYRFAGSDIHIMRNFGEMFGGAFADETAVHRTVDLGRTFRSVDRIALAARRFVLQNPAQINKKVVPAGIAPDPAIRVVWTKRDEGDAPLRNVLRGLGALPSPLDRKTSVLLLGRYRHIDPGLRDLQRAFPQLTLGYKTIHASKGLEADHVVLLGADASRVGFPSEITDDPLLSLVSPEAEPFENAEERRVMYVAMTRARSTLTIIASRSRPSAFVSELLADPEYGLQDSSAGTTALPRCGKCGGQLVPVQSQAGRVWYRCQHDRHCGNVLPACPDCETGLPQPHHENGHACGSCDAAFQSCPVCTDGWLVLRKGRYGSFLGCVRYPECSGKAKPERPKGIHRNEETD